MPELSYREAVRDALSQAMREDEDVFIMGEDIAEMGGSMGVTQGMLDEFGPERVRNTPISEMAIVGSGIGAAMQGMRPVVEVMYEDFLTISMEQIVNQAAKHRYMSGGQLKVPLTIRTQGGAGWLTICSIETVRKSSYMTSTTGRMPCIAAPIPAPTIAISEIGVLRIRSGPNSSSMPAVTPIEPPISAMSSPITNTLSSCRIACDSASRPASR